MCQCFQQDFPEDEVIRCESKDVVESYFMSAVKEVCVQNKKLTGIYSLGLDENRIIWKTGNDLL
jgi:hypothetical protein